MKYIKLYEEIDTQKEGDYVLMKSKSTHVVANIINNTIGKIIKIEDRQYVDHRGVNQISIRVKYDLPQSILKKLEIDNIRDFTQKQIVEFGSTIEELELKLAAKKYNIL